MIALTEPIVITDVFASGMAECEDMGDGNVRLVFYTRQRSTYGEASEFENVIVARVIMPLGGVLPAIRAVMRSTGYACCGAGKMRERH